MSVATEAAIAAAKRAQSYLGADDKLSELAKAIEALAQAIGEIEKAVSPPR
jgi:cell fate (sporulation/competence/biofilm development) regulator YlbF (YheA/YmcA/DUF963 family)